MKLEERTSENVLKTFKVPTRHNFQAFFMLNTAVLNAAGGSIGHCLVAKTANK